ncbi:MAG: hypothetical protein ABF379_13630, partial [Akkermansiaceae bacterium]
MLVASGRSDKLSTSESQPTKTKAKNPILNFTILNKLGRDPGQPRFLLYSRQRATLLLVGNRILLGQNSIDNVDNTIRRLQISL